MKTFPILLLACVGFLFTACADVYYSRDAKSVANAHQTIAVLPPTVTIQPKRRISSAALKEQQRLESQNIQAELYSWLLKRQMQNRIFVNVQDVDVTNAKLLEAGQMDQRTMSPPELAALLNVDAVVSSKFSLAQPISEIGAIAVAVLFERSAPTNRVGANLSIQDQQTGTLIWNFDHEVRGNLGSTPERLVNTLMRRASKTMPYYEKERY